jgi:hypothetical protein
MLRHLCQFLVVFFFFAAFLAQRANAEPITTLAISRGIIEGDFAPDADSFWDVSGDSFSLLIRDGIELPPPASVRSSYSPSYTFVTSFLSGLLTVNSSRISFRGFRDATVQVTFTAPPQPLGRVFDDRSTGFSFPFTMTAVLSGRDLNTGESFGFGLEGQGKGRLFGRLLGLGFNDLFVADLGIWEFESTAPVPEPTTVLLLSAAGIAGGVRKWRLRARR